MGNSPSNILFRLRTKGHITDDEYHKLKTAITIARDENEPTTFIGDKGAYDSFKRCVKCGYKTTRYILNDANAKYCPKCGRQIKVMIHNKIIDEVD